MDELAALLTHKSRQLLLIAIVGKCVCVWGGVFFLIISL